MSVIQAVKQVASDVAGTVKTAAGKSATEIAKTPLDLLEELLGQSPGDKKPEGEKLAMDEGLSGAQGDPEELKAKEKADEEYRVTRMEQLHTEIEQRSQGYYDQKKIMDGKKKEADEQKEAQKLYQVENLQRRKSDDYALKAAQDAASAEKRVGAG